MCPVLASIDGTKGRPVVDASDKAYHLPPHLFFIMIIDYLSKSLPSHVPCTIHARIPMSPEPSTLAVWFPYSWYFSPGVQGSR